MVVVRSNPLKMLKTHKVIILKFLCGLICINTFIINNVYAKDAEFSPSLIVGVGYSDNIDLEATNVKSSAYTRVNPGFTYSKQGSRVKSQVDYNVNGLFYESESELDDAQHNLYANVDSELVKNSIFLDLNATISQQLLDNDRYTSPGGVAGSDNLTETYTYGFAPYWNKKWSNVATSQLKYNYNDVSYSDNDGDDSTANNVTLNVESGKQFTQFFWNFDYNHTDTSYETDVDTSFDGYKLRVGYYYSRKLSLTATTGYEDYSDSREDGGTGWRAGVIWSPSQRTNLEFEAGQRFFGSTYLLDFKHQHRRLTWHFKYDDSITDSRDQIINNNDSVQETPEGIVPPLTNFTAQYYLSRRLTGDVSYSLKNSTITLGLFSEWRYFNDTDQKDEDDSGANLNWNLNLGRRTSMNTRFSWDQLEDTLNNNTQDRSSFIWSLNRNISRSMTGELMVSYNNNEADIKTDEFTENAISFNIRKVF